MSKILYDNKAIQSVINGKMAFFKFLSANDTGLTGGHQSGIYIPKKSSRILFDTPGVRGENKDRLIKISWQGEVVTDSRIIYYGKKTRNEYRITRCKSNEGDFLSSDNTGSLIVLVQNDYEDYSAWILITEDEIESFLGYFGINPTDTGRLIGSYEIPAEIKKQREIEKIVQSLKGDFPQTEIMAELARKIYGSVYCNKKNMVFCNPDEVLLRWINMEYELFKMIEENLYGRQICQGFSSMQIFIDTANSILNRRKSRAGKSLEYHLSAIFDINKLQYEAQVITEGRKRPDFIFPSGKSYHDLTYDVSKLIILGAKTTCKDRWRQVINEADRVKIKYLCTLQQGISPQQLCEMKKENVVLVVPKPYIPMYPPEYRDDIYNLSEFIDMVREKIS